ncbi:MAG: DUF547 domain-containing protein [Nitrospinae bacterium]|nr:DUF547 domain-containing protein [Nitrospinota bacterium]
MLTAAVLALVFPSSARAFDFSAWDGILKQNTRRSVYQGVAYAGFDYAAILNSREFARLLADLEAFSPETLRGRDEKMAFWINAYNIFAVSLVLQNYPVKGIKDAGTLFTPVWKVRAGKVGGKPYTLDYIEHEILRPMGEPGVHFAIVCASVSCPDLRAEAYRPTNLADQLDSQLGEFLRNPGKGLRTEQGSRTAHLSKIFRWYEKDFDKAGGALNFINRRLGDSLAIPKEYAIKYMPYIWELNSVR